MKSVISAFIAIFLSVSFFSCPATTHPSPTRRGVVHLHVLQSDGTPFTETEAGRFSLQYSGQYPSDSAKAVLDADDNLVFELSTITIRRREKEVKDSDIVKSLEGYSWFAILDNRGEYKTVKKMYRECYKRHNKNPTNRNDHTWCDYIYHCEVQLEKK